LGNVQLEDGDGRETKMDITEVGYEKGKWMKMGSGSCPGAGFGISSAGLSSFIIIMFVT